MRCWRVARPHEAHVRGTGAFDSDPAAWDPGRVARLDPTRTRTDLGSTVVDTVLEFVQQYPVLGRQTDAQDA